MPQNLPVAVLAALLVAASCGGDRRAGSTGGGGAGDGGGGAGDGGDGGQAGPGGGGGSEDEPREGEGQEGEGQEGEGQGQEGEGQEGEGQEGEGQEGEGQEGEGQEGEGQEGEGQEGEGQEGEGEEPPPLRGWPCLLQEADAATCTDGVDNDENGFTDCEDFHCALNPTVAVCAPRENSDALCADGLDNDNDGVEDCGDTDCRRSPWVTVCEANENTDARCVDGVDNDGDGHLDCEDLNCLRNPFVRSCGDLCALMPDPDPDPRRCPFPLVINKVFHNPPDDNEALATFIELAGPPGASLDGVELQYWPRLAAALAAPERRLSLEGSRVGADGYFVIAHPDGLHAARLDRAVLPPEFDIDVQNSGGYLRLQRPGPGPPQDLDGVGWGRLPNGNLFGEGTPAIEGGNGDGLTRTDFADTDDNRADFLIVRGPTPRGPARGACR